MNNNNTTVEVHVVKKNAVQIAWQSMQGVWKDLGVTEAVKPLCVLNLWGFTLDYIDCVYTCS